MTDAWGDSIAAGATPYIRGKPTSADFSPEFDAIDQITTTCVKKHSTATCCLPDGLFRLYGGITRDFTSDENIGAASGRDAGSHLGK